MAALAIPTSAPQVRMTPPVARPPRHGYNWQVITDPTGDFLGHWFRHADIMYGTWEPGTVFHNPINRSTYCVGVDGSIIKYTSKRHG